LQNNLTRTDFIELFKSITDTKTGGSLKPYKNTYKYLTKFAGGSKAICDIDRDFCLNFKEFLTLPELCALKKTAFLFSCYTGLWYGDIESLHFEDIREGYLHFRQQKTEGYERIKLSQNALDIISRQREINDGEGKVFRLLYHTTTQQHINQWVEDAEINKHITWHSGRHTFATLALTHDIDLYTVSKLL
jgi:integrase